MNNLSKQQLENQMNAFNSAYKVGDTVEVLKTSNGTETFVDEISFKATIMGGNTVMTWLKKAGSYNASFVKGIFTPTTIE